MRFDVENDVIILGKENRCTLPAATAPGRYINIFLPSSLALSPTTWRCIPLGLLVLGHKGAHPIPCRHPNPSRVLPLHLITPNRPMNHQATRISIDQALQRRRYQRTCRYLTPISVNTRGQESIPDLTSITRRRSRAKSCLIPPAVTPHIPGKAMALGMVIGLCTRRRLAQDGRVGPLQIKPRSRCIHPWPRSSLR